MCCVVALSACSYARIYHHYLHPQQWIEEQKEFAGLERIKRNVWVQIQLDGTVRSSDLGTPPWARILADLPPLDSFKTKVTDGIGPSV